jgi:hypothetical protein
MNVNKITKDFYNKYYQYFLPEIIWNTGLKPAALNKITKFRKV